ncbi:toll/interleukin-1 receptor domain-containing protein [Armatimonas rosea]|uniref:TIR domain-containing protein n=1 Tax=Armatimonas rosea TaxID=685828 RepID=A0A7W9SW02_ARMRO|nr:toll/interleukin-1 receptor domain-containing protein [Armatimonas rosea]MBB6053877.1 hypothetical protein [Armatimonas rosea]
MSTDKPLLAFLSYSHKDEALLNALRTHLSPLTRQGIIAQWHDRMILAGTEWAGEIDRNLETADLILLLISPDFIASTYCYDTEMKRALERHDAGEARIIPIILRPCDWHGSPFGRLQALPTDAKPVTGASWHNQDEAFVAVASGIRKAALDWRGRASKAATPSPVPVPRTSLLRPKTPTLAPDEPVAASYPRPKPRPTAFNAYQAGRDILTFVETGLVERMKDIEAAGYIVDHDRREGRICFRVESDSRTIYFLDMWLGGAIGGDKSLGFYDGWGNNSGGSGAMTATATPVLSEESGEPVLEIINFSLLNSRHTQKTYSKEEFLEALWEKIVSTVDQLGRQRR